MKRKHHGRTIDTSVRVNATPMQVWQAWTDPQQIANWFVDRAEGKAEPGGTMKWFFDMFGLAIDVPVIDAEQGRTFVTGSGDQPGPDGLPYLMEITIAKDGGDTVMNLVNSGFSEAPEKDKSFRDTESGWQCALATLKVWLERYPELRRRRTLLMRQIAHTADRLHPLYATDAGRERWLTPEVPVDGDVLVDTGTEVLLAWPGERAVLGLKSFGAGPHQMVALDLSQWSETGAGPSEDARARLDRALDRLVTLL